MTKNTLRSLAFSIALATGAGGLMQAAHAAPAATAPQASAETPHGHHWKHGERRHHMRAPFTGSVAGVLVHLKSKLNLTDSQQTLWNAARSKQQEVGKAMRAQFTEDRKALRQQVDAGPIDFRAVAARKEQARAALQPQLNASRDAWLVVYDSLDATQKQTVSAAVKRGLDRAAHRGGPRGEAKAKS